MPEYPYFQAVADLLTEEEETASPWFWPEWQMLFCAILIPNIYFDSNLRFLQLWLLRNSHFMR